MGLVEAELLARPLRSAGGRARGSGVRAEPSPHCLSSYSRVVQGVIPARGMIILPTQASRESLKVESKQQAWRAGGGLIQMGAFFRGCGSS